MQKREPKFRFCTFHLWLAIFILIPLLVGAGIVAFASTETSALIVVDKKIQKVGAQRDIDLGHLEKSISCLETQRDS